MSGVSIEYKGSTIATIQDSGSKVLKTQGKYCERDILVEYEAPQPTLITKQITANGTYSAEDDNADGYSEVTVAVPDASIAILDSLIDGTITKINSNVTKIRNNAFSATSLESAIFPFATTIGNNAFLGDMLTSVSFPSVTHIGITSFQACIRLPRAVFPKVTEISNGAFAGCTALTTIVLNSRAVARSTNIVPSHTIVYVENNDLEWYSTATNWSVLYANGQIKSIDELPPEEATS